MLIKKCGEGKDIVKNMRFGNGLQNTCLHVAVASLHQVSINGFLDFLIHDCGIDVNTTNDKGQTPLHMFPRTLDHNAQIVMSHLLSHGADIQIKDNNGENFLSQVLPHDVKTARILLDAKKFDPKTTRFNKDKNIFHIVFENYDHG
jgi:ankyrin repeat protein